MKVISAIYNEQKNAGPKAPKDIDKILERKYNANCKSVVRIGKYKLKLLLYFISFYLTKDVIILQHPLLHKAFFYNFLPKNRSIILIHDLNGLRSQNDESIKNEIIILKKFNYIIVHNNKMKEYLISKGIEEEKLYVLELFDYLTDAEAKQNNNFDKNDIKIVYCGNLKKEKSVFLYQLDSDILNFQMNLYGLGINENLSDKLIYKGSFEPDEIGVLNGDFGLVWDGKYDESDENIGFKYYTQYNNPHKLSCYIAAGLPVIVWRKAAIAEFVKKYEIGYTISNIYDINNLDFSDFEIKKKNIEKLSKKVKSGEFTLDVINKIMEDMKK